MFHIINNINLIHDASKSESRFDEDSWESIELIYPTI